VAAIWVCDQCGSEWATAKEACPDCGGSLKEGDDRTPEPWEPATWTEVVTTSPAWAAARLISGRRCPWCRGRVAKWAVLCAHCRHELTPPNVYAPRVPS
jgi:predicted amidophosphoribosyltransferase